MSQKKILVADDERPLVRLLQVNLEKRGFQVDAAYDGKEVLKKVKKGHYDLVLLNIMMPHFDGLEVLKKLRADKETEALPIIIISQKASEKGIWECYHYGADMYLTKPLDMGEVMMCVKRVTNPALET